MANTIKLGNGNWATKEGSLLAYNDENNNFKPLPFTTTRASSASVVNKQGLIETVGSGIPRIDFSDDANGALLLEPTSTNLVTYSEDFSNAVWGTWQLTKTLSNNINPKGTNGYYEISHTGNSSDNPNTRLENVSLNGSYTLSFFVKINQSRYISLSIEDYDGDRARVYFDTINKTFTTISNVGSPITNTSYSEFSNGWIRISLSVNLLNAVYNEVGIGIYNPSGSFPSASGEVISVFAGQLEQGNASSYIPTQGTTQTRSADTASGSGNSTVINSTQGTLYAEISALGGISNRYISLSDGTTQNRVSIFYYSVSNRIRTIISSGGVNVVDLSFLVTSELDFHKVAVKYNLNDFSLWIDSVEVGTDALGVVPIGLSDLSFSDGSGSNNFKGKTKSVQVYTTALSDAELTSLTTI